MAYSSHTEFENSVESIIHRNARPDKISLLVTCKIIYKLKRNSRLKSRELQTSLVLAQVSCCDLTRKSVQPWDTQENDKLETTTVIKKKRHKSLSTLQRKALRCHSRLLRYSVQIDESECYGRQTLV